MTAADHRLEPLAESFSKLTRSLVLAGAIAVLVTGIAVATVAMGPLYSTLARLQESHQLSLVASRGAAVEEYIFRLQEIAEQIASRTRAREKLEELNRGETTLLDYQQFSTPILSDALKVVRHVEGITRFDANGDPVLGVGKRIPHQLWTELTATTESPERFARIDIEAQPYLVVSTDIVNRVGEVVGSDLVLFSDERIRQIVSETTGLTAGAGVLFVDGPLGEFPTTLVGGESLITPGGESALRRVSEKLFSKLSSTSSGFTQHDGLFAACTTVSGTSWRLLLYMPTDVLYAPLRGQIGWVLAVIVLLLALGAYAATVLLRPLSGRVTLKAEELAQELTNRRASEARHRAVFEHSPIGIWEEDYSGVKCIIDRLRDEGVTDFRAYFSTHREVVREAAVSIRMLAANQAAFDIYETTNLGGFRDARVFAENYEMWDDFYTNEFAALAEGHTRVTVEAAARTTSKKYIRVRTITQIPDFSRDTWSFVVSSEENITDRHAVEVALRESEERYGHIAEAMKVVPLEMDPETLGFTYIGPQAVAQFGHSLQAWKQPEFWLGLIHPDDLQAVEQQARAAIASGVDHDLEYRLRTADDQYVWLRHFIRVSQHQEGARWWGVLWDNSASKRSEDDKHRLETQLRQAQKMEAIGQLTGGLAHDFNNILANVLGYTYLAEEHLATRPDGKLSGYMDEVRRAGERARNLVAQMLAFSRGGGSDAQPTPIAPVVLEAVKLLQSTLPASVQLNTRLDPMAPVVLTNPGQLHQSVMNLCINARDAMQGHGRVNIDVHLLDEVTATCASCGELFQGRFGVVSVSDTGPGISADIRSRIFEPFFSTKEFGKGSGMGLAMIHGIAHEHGGHILVDECASGGATIRLLLAVSEPAAVPAETAPLSEHVVSLPSTTGHILVVDDELSVARFLSDLLERHGYDVTYLTNSRAAVTVFDAEPNGFDLVLTDQTMPEISGVELAQILVQKRANLPVILCTGYADGVDETRLESQGIRGFVTKPIDIPLLLSLVEQLLHDAHPVKNVIDDNSRFASH